MFIDVPLIYLSLLALSACGLVSRYYGHRGDSFVGRRLIIRTPIKKTFLYYSRDNLIETLRSLIKPDTFRICTYVYEHYNSSLSIWFIFWLTPLSSIYLCSCVNPRWIAAIYLYKNWSPRLNFLVWIPYIFFNFTGLYLKSLTFYQSFLCLKILFKIPSLKYRYNFCFEYTWKCEFKVKQTNTPGICLNCFAFTLDVQIYLTKQTKENVQHLYNRI